MSFSFASGANLATRNSYTAGVDAATRATSVHALEVEDKEVLIDPQHGGKDDGVGQFKLGIKLRGWPAVRAYGTVVLVWLISLLAQYDRFVISFFSAELIADLGLSASQYGMLSGFATGLVYALFSLPLGFVTERYLRRVWVLAAGCAWWSACLCFQGLANSFGVMVAARIGMGLGQAAAETLTVSLIPDLVPPEQVSVCESFYYTSIYLAAALGGGISTIFSVLGISWRWAFIGVGVFGVLLGVLFAILVREPEKGAYLIKGEDTQMKYQPKKSVKYLMGLKAGWIMVLAAGIREMGGYTYGFFMPGFIKATFPDRSGSNLIYGLVCAVFGGGTMLLSGFLCKRYYLTIPQLPAYLTGVGGLVATVFVIGQLYAAAWFGQSTGYIMVWVFMALEYTFAEMFLGPIISLLALVFPPALRTFGISMFQAIVASIGSSAPELTGLILHATGHSPGTPGFVMATRTVLSVMIPATYVIACALFLVVGLRVRRDMDARAQFVQTDTVAPLTRRRVVGLAVLMLALVAYIVTLLVLSITNH